MIALGLYVIVMTCLTVGYYFTLLSLKQKEQDQAEEQKTEPKQDKPKKQLQEYEHV